MKLIKLKKKLQRRIKWLKKHGPLDDRLEFRMLYLGSLNEARKIYYETFKERCW